MSTASAPEALAASRDPAAMLAALHHALTLMPDNIDAMVGLAGLYLQNGRLDKAGQWCAQALARRPDHGPALKIRTAVGNAYVEAGMRMLVAGNLVSAIEVFTRAVEAGNAEARHYLALFRQADAWFTAAAALPREEGSSRLGLAVWGEAYARAAITMFRSMLAPGNIPALAAAGPVYLEITTTAAERTMLDASPVMEALRAHANVNYFIIGDDILAYDRAKLPGFQYWIMATVHYATVMRARHAGSHASFLTADSVIADGSYAAARRYIDAGKYAVMFAALEVDRDPFMAALGDRGEGVLAVQPRALTEHALAHLHHDTTTLILEPGKTMSAPVPHPLMFRIDGGLVQLGFHLGPMMMSADIMGRDFAPDFLTSDTRLLRLALGDGDYDRRIKVVDDTAEIAAVSMSRQMPKEITPHPFDPERLGKWASRWCFGIQDIPYFEWCFLQRRALRGHSATGPVPAPSDFETTIVDSVLSAFRRHAVQRVRKL